MTAKQLYEHVLTELNKVNAPALLLSDFNYLVNKGIQQYLNKRYTAYEIDQQTSDDLRVLASSASLSPVKCDKYKNSPTRRGTYEANLPDDYWHILNCTCIYKVLRNNRCDEADQYVEYGAKRLTADIWPTIMRNAYNKPKYSNPYFYIHNVNTSQDMPTNPLQFDEKGNLVSGTDPYVVGQNRQTLFTITPETLTVGKEGGQFRFEVNSKDYNGDYLDYNIQIENLPIKNDESGVLLNGPGKRSFIVDVPENEQNERVYYLTFIQNETNQQKTVATIQKAGEQVVQYRFRLTTDIAQWKNNPTESIFEKGCKTFVAEGDTCDISVDMTDLRSMALEFPNAYELKQVIDGLGNPVSDHFVGDSGCMGVTGNICYIRHLIKSNNVYTFKFEKKHG